MRRVAIAVVLLVTASARADSVFDVLGGLAAPIADDNWTKTIDTSGKLAIHAGGTTSNTATSFGGMLGLDWTPAKTGSSGGFASYSLNRFRALVSGFGLFRVGSRLMLEARAGVGIDLTYTQATVLGSSSSDTEVGVAVEVGGGAWFDVGSIDIGGEVALPISIHSQHTFDGIPFPSYTSVDIDLLLGVRFRH